jgi:hypothetical protein
MTEIESFIVFAGGYCLMIAAALEAANFAGAAAYALQKAPEGYTASWTERLRVLTQRTLYRSPALHFLHAKIEGNTPRNIGSILAAGGLVGALVANSLEAGAFLYMTLLSMQLPRILRDMNAD